MEKKLGIPLVHIDESELSNTLEILIRSGKLEKLTFTAKNWVVSYCGDLNERFGEKLRNNSAHEKFRIETLPGIL
jgi:hypothetical protein